MRTPLRFRTTYPYLLVALSAVAGVWFGSAGLGIRTDYNIDEAVTAEGIAKAYGSALTDMAALHNHDDVGEREQLRARLRTALGADPTVVAAYAEVRSTNAGTHFDYIYSNPKIESKSESCVMRSQEALRSGLIRCNLTTNHGRFDIVKFTRPMRQTDDVTALAVLKLDYSKLRRRLREG